MRARLALHYAGVSIEIHEVQLRAKPPELLRLSPKGTVPVLLLPNSDCPQGRPLAASVPPRGSPETWGVPAFPCVVLEQSADIMFWALAQADPHGWRRPELDEEALPWLALNDGPFKQLLDRYKYPDRHPQQTQMQWRAEAEALMLAPLERRLCSQAYLLGASPSWLDLALLPFVRQFAGVDKLWFEASLYPALRSWMQTWIASELFVAIMAKPAHAAQSAGINS